MICGGDGVGISRGDVTVILGEENGNGEACKSLLGNQLGSLPGTPSSNRKGLQNHLGENNCFLNSIVQVLWRLDPFRKSFLLLSGHACTEKSCIFCALKVVFTQFQFSDRSTLPPDSLRRALAIALAKRSRFQLGLMDDATECFEIILRWLHFHLVYEDPFDGCSAPHCISHSKFGMNITEQTFCILCGTKTRPLTFTELVHYVPTSAIARQLRTSMNGNRTCFGRILRNDVDTEGRSCPAGCGEGLQLNQVLMNSPDILTIGLVWDSDSATPNDIAQLVSSIDSTLRPSDLFQSSLSAEFRLVGVVCYYRKHYSTFLFDQHDNIWSLYDDATIVQVGSSWSVVAAKICVGRFQPLLLFYENPQSEPVSMATAPTRTRFVDIPSDLSSFAHGDSLTDLALSMKRQVADYEGGNPSVAQSRSFSSSLEEVSTLQENSSVTLNDIPITVTHHSSRDSSISEECNLNCRSKVKVQSAIDPNSDWHPEKSHSDATPDKDNNRNPWTTGNRSGQQDCPPSFADSRPGLRGFSDNGSSCHLSSPCTTPPVTSLGCGVQADSLKKTKSGTTTCNTGSDFGQCFWERSKFMPSFRNSSAQMFVGDGPDFSTGDWHPVEMLRNKRSSFACSAPQNSFALDELSCYSSDDQFFSLGSRSSARRFPFSQGFFTPRWSSGSAPFGSISRNSQLIDDALDTQDSYINPETVLTVLRSRGLKLHSGLGSHGRKGLHNGSGSLSSTSLSEEIRNLSVPIQVTHVTSDSNIDSCNNSNSNETSKTTQTPCLSSSPAETNAHCFVTPPLDSTTHPETKRQQKGILMKRRHEKKKRVSFSDNVALVLCADDVPSTQPQNYVDYVRQVAAQSHNLRSSSLSSTSSSDSAYSSSSDSTSGSTTSPLPDLPESLVEGMSSVEVSGFSKGDEELDSEDDTCIPEEDLDGSSNKIRCNLCCRKWIVAPDIYCRDCDIYLNRLQHRM